MTSGGTASTTFGLLSGRAAKTVSAARPEPTPAPCRRVSTRCAPDGQHCPRCNGVHNVDTHGRRTFVTSLTWDTTEDDDTDEWQA